MVASLKSLIALLLLCLSSTAQAEWFKSVSPNFVVYSEARRPELENFIEKLERFDAYLRLRYNIKTKAPYKLTIYQLQGDESLQRLFPSLGKNTRGFYAVGPNGPSAWSARTVGASSMDLEAIDVMFHEYAHHFMMQYLPGANPTWYVEGFAEFFATTTVGRDYRMTIGKPPYYRGYDLFYGDHLPIRDLLEARHSSMKGDQIYDLYARAWLLTHYLIMNGSRRQQLTQYLALLEQGKENLQAAESAFGDLDKLAAEIRVYSMRKSNPVVTTQDPVNIDGTITITAIEPDEVATMADRMKIARGFKEEDRAGVIASLQANRAALPRNTSVRQLLAQALFLSDKLEAASTEIDAALALAPGDATIQRLKGQIELAKLDASKITDPARWKAARALVIRANRADPESPFPLFDYYRSFVMEGTAPSAPATEGLRKAFYTIPQDPNVRATYVSALIGQKNYRAAIAVLRPVANDPHNGSGNKEAKRTLKALQNAVASGKTLDEELRALPDL